MDISPLINIFSFRPARQNNTSKIQKLVSYMQEKNYLCYK